MEQVLPQGEAISCQTLPRLGPAHTKRLRKLWSYGRPVHVAQLEGVDFDLQVHGFLETMCRIPDDCIDSKRYPLFMARAVLKELVESLQSTQGVKPC